MSTKNKSNRQVKKSKKISELKNQTINPFFALIPSEIIYSKSFRSLSGIELKIYILALQKAIPAKIMQIDGTEKIVFKDKAFHLPFKDVAEYLGISLKNHNIFYRAMKNIIKQKLLVKIEKKVGRWTEYKMPDKWILK